MKKIRNLEINGGTKQPENKAVSYKGILGKIIGRAEKQTERILQCVQTTLGKHFILLYRYPLRKGNLDR